MSDRDDVSPGAAFHKAIENGYRPFYPTLRDYLAGQAMWALLARTHWSPEGASKMAYEIADAMIAARKADQ